MGGRASFDFSGNRVLVTGASRGIGRGVAEAFAAAGADTILLAEDEAVEEAAAAIRATAAGEVDAVVCDIAEPEAVARTIAALPALDVLIDNAGLERPTPLAGEPETDITFRRILEVNLAGTWQVTRAVLPRMAAGGRIVVTSSIWGKVAVADFSAYVATKHGLVGMVKTWARELGPRGIRVNAVCPGWVETESSMRSLAAMARTSGRPEPELLDEIVAAQALDGLMSPADVAGLYLFLASDAAANITGQAIAIDRGETLA